MTTNKRGTRVGKPNRLIRTCNICKHRHQKCTGTRPKCQHCEVRGLECVYSGNLEDKSKSAASSSCSSSDRNSIASSRRSSLALDRRPSLEQQQSCLMSPNDHENAYDNYQFESDCNQPPHSAFLSNEDFYQQNPPSNHEAFRFREVMHNPLANIRARLSRESLGECWEAGDILGSEVTKVEEPISNTMQHFEMPDPSNSRDIYPQPRFYDFLLSEAPEEELGFSNPGNRGLGIQSEVASWIHTCDDADAEVPGGLFNFPSASSSYSTVPDPMRDNHNSTIDSWELDDYPPNVSLSSGATDLGWLPRSSISAGDMPALGLDPEFSHQIPGFPNPKLVPTQQASHAVGYVCGRPNQQKGTTWKGESNFRFC